MKTYCYINGKIMRTEKGFIPVTDLALQRGYGVFDYIRTYHGKLFLFEYHLSRLQSSAETLHLKLPLSNAELRKIAEKLIQKSDLKNPAIRILLTGGDSRSSPLLAKPNLIMISEELPLWPKELYSQGVKLVIVDYQRVMPEEKTINYLNALYLEPFKRKQEAFDLLYTHQGSITECTKNNFFVFLNGVLITPPADQVLSGITRKVVLGLAKTMFPVEERRLMMDELDACEEAFLTSTSKGVMPVTQIDGKEIGSGKIGTQTQRVMKLFKDYTLSY